VKSSVKGPIQHRGVSRCLSSLQNPATLTSDMFKVFERSVLYIKSDKYDYRMDKVISVTEAARSFADCVNRAHYQKVTFVLLKGGSPVARIMPDEERVCSGADLSKALAGAKLAAGEKSSWSRDLRNARSRLKPLRDKWR
jgi:antitoxin (DNA-binding transcriptional repressor) of toxin-antitoxin stability system